MGILGTWMSAGLLALLMASCAQPSGDQEAIGAPREQAQENADLAEVLASGAVTLVQARGNGASSGNSINAVLRNNTGQNIDVDIFMKSPVYLANSGAGQNMIASMVVGSDGAYRMEGQRQFVTLKPNEQMVASMVAYCADFAKENPTAQESFSVAQSPATLAPVITRINDYVRANPDANVTAAAQVAVWMAQGESPEAIANKFEFSEADEHLARSFLQ